MTPVDDLGRGRSLQKVRWPLNEMARQARVHALCLTDPTPDGGLDRIVAATSAYFDVPIALVSILDEQRQWFRARVGLAEQQTPRDDAFCAYAILGQDLLEVPDATGDERFVDNPLVTGEPGIRYYAGMPLTTTDGLALGSLCVIDTKPRAPMSARDRMMLKHFAGLVMGRITSLRAQHYVDEPTGLYNRLRLQEDVTLALKRDDEIVIVAADLLSPRHTNDIINALGYTFFDGAMRAFKMRLEALLPEGCPLYTIGPTRFAFLLDRPHAEQDDALYRRILSEFGTEVLYEGIPVRADVALGVLPLKPSLHRDSDWLRLVVSAANEARERDLGWTHFDPATDRAQQRGFTLLTDLAEAVQSDDQLWLAYQPVIDLKTGACTAVEALLRWEHPVFGPVGPGEFIALAEKTALIRPLSRWVLRKSIEQTAAWRRMGYTFKVAINTSPQDFEDPTYMDLMLRLLHEHHVDPDSFKIEFTESALINDPDEVAQQLQRASDAGAVIAIDDFGTGYSNWIYLRDLPASVVKIDQAFIHELATTPRDQHLTRSIIELAKGMGLRIVAEGIETQEALTLLREWGCDEGQGYLIARPMPPTALLQWLEARRDERGFNPEQWSSASGFSH